MRKKPRSPPEQSLVTTSCPCGSSTSWHHSVSQSTQRRRQDLPTSFQTRRVSAVRTDATVTPNSTSCVDPALWLRSSTHIWSETFHISQTLTLASVFQCCHGNMWILHHWPVSMITVTITSAKRPAVDFFDTGVTLIQSWATWTKSNTPTVLTKYLDVKGCYDTGTSTSIHIHIHTLWHHVHIHICI